MQFVNLLPYAAVRKKRLSVVDIKYCHSIKYQDRKTSKFLQSKVWNSISVLVSAELN